MELVDTIKLQKKKQHAETADIEDGDQEPLLEVSQVQLPSETCSCKPFQVMPLFHSHPVTWAGIRE